MILAQSFSEGLFWTLMFIGVGLWAARKLLRDSDKDGAIRGAAKDGIIRVISRWLK
jgi:hypothetical protein